MIKVALMSCLVLLTAVMSLAGPARTLRVPGEYPTVQAALDAASSGDVIEVAPGVYTEDLVIAQSVTLRGELVPVVVGGGKSSFPPFPWELDTGVQIVGTGDRSEAVVVKGNANVTLEFLTVSGGRMATVVAEGQSRLVIRHTAIMKSGAMGVLVRDSAQVLFDRSLAARNPTHGVVGLDSAEILLRNCLLVGNGGSALLIAGRSKAEVTGCLAYHNLKGIEVVDTGRAVVQDSVAWGNAVGLWVAGGPGAARLELRQCTVSANGEGVFAFGPAQLTLENNLVADNRNNGVLLVDRVSLIAISNRILRNGGHGIRLLLSACPAGPFDPALSVRHAFHGDVTGHGNRIPGPSEPGGNLGGGVCPDPRDYPWPEGFLGP